MTADDVREEIARATCPRAWEEDGTGAWSPYTIEHRRNIARLDADRILPILARREQEAYQRGQAEERQRIAAAIKAMPEERNETLHQLLDSGQMYADWIYGYGRAWGTDAARIAERGGA